MNATAIRILSAARSGPVSNRLEAMEGFLDLLENNPSSSIIHLLPQYYSLASDSNLQVRCFIADSIRRISLFIASPEGQGRLDQAEFASNKATSRRIG